MATAKWTAAQSRAIEKRGKTVLVSAAAGSGKTTTLTERIIRKLTEKDSTADISRFLIVTFTKAAASDLKSKISRALGEALARDPSNRRLSLQMIKLGGADICTIDSFYYSVVRRNFEKLGLPGTLGMMDESELKIMRARIMEEVIDFFYESRGEAFCEFMDCFMDYRGGSDAVDILNGIYNTLGGYPEFLEYLKNNEELLCAESEMPFLETRAGKVIKGKALKFFEHAEKIYSDALGLINNDPTAAKAYFPAFEYDRVHFEMTERAVRDGDYSRASELFGSYVKMNLGGLRNGDPIFAQYKELRAGCCEDYKDIGSRFFSSSVEQLKNDIKRTADFCTQLYDLLSEFHRRFSEEKLSRSSCDFTDNKQFTFKLFIDGNGEPTQLAREYSERYDEVYIDEYQDTDLVQDMIFSAIAKPDGRFMVGDIKQSIYRFRGANPAVFASYKGSFPKDTEASDEDKSCAIYMSENFRCDRSVIDFTNRICGYLFKKSPNSICYAPEDDLICSKTVAPADREIKKAQVNIIRAYDARALTKLSDEETARLEGKGSELEALHIAGEIKRILSDENETCEDRGRLRRIEPRDIAILTRNNSSADEIAQVLTEHGIPTSARTTVNYFENPEVLLAMSLLNVIDNPHRDVHLAAVLRSPLFGFSLGELVSVRQGGERGVSLYDDILRASCDSTDEILVRKIEYFKEKLELYRRRASLLSVDKLIRFIFSDTAMLSFAGSEEDEERSTEERRANLLLLYDHARRYENGAYKGLYSFIGYINGMIESGQTVEPAASPGSGNVVNVMTIHNSKGLEFPVCFIAATQKRLSRNKKNTIEFDRDTGLGALFKDKGGFACLETPIYSAIRAKNAGDELEEELRVLYVALTRARERLYISGYVKSDGFLQKAQVSAEYADEYSILGCGSYLELVAIAMMANGMKEDMRILQPYEINRFESGAERTELSDNVLSSSVSEKLSRIFEDRFDFKYGYAHLGSIPAKLSVSRLYPEVLDREDTGATLPAETELKEKPAFLVPEPERATAAEKGTATHTFLQFCSFENVDKNGIEAELERLTSVGLMENSVCLLVNIRELEQFFDGDFYRMLKQIEKDGGRLYREQRFNICLNAEDFTGDPALKDKLTGENILVQGVMDLVAIKADGSILLCDYKTDRLSFDELKDKAKAAKKLSDRHSLQLSYYSQAVKLIFGEKPLTVCIYSLPLGDTIDINV